MTLPIVERLRRLDAFLAPNNRQITDCAADLLERSHDLLGRLLGTMGIDACGYDAALYYEAEALLAKIGGES